MSAGRLAEELLRELEADEDARRRLARLLAPEFMGDRELRLSMLNALYREAATRGDLRELGEQLSSQLARLEERVARLEGKIDGLVKWVVGLLATMWATLVAALVAALLG